MTAAAGRKAAPAVIRLVGGTGKGRDSGNRLVKPPPGFARLPPEAPVELGEIAAAEWQRVVPELQRLRLVKPIDRAALTSYCLTWERLVRAQRILDERTAESGDAGLLYEGKQGLVRHPAVGLVEAASKDLRAWCSEFGLTPAAESKVAATEADDGSSTAFD